MTEILEGDWSSFSAGKGLKVSNTPWRAEVSVSLNRETAVRGDGGVIHFEQALTPLDSPGAIAACAGRANFCAWPPLKIDTR